MAGQIRRNYDKSFFAVIVATIALTIAAACKSDNASDPPVAVASVTVSPAVVDLLIGQTRQLTATTEGAAGVPLTGRTVTWSASSAVATVSGSGLVTAVSPGSSTITATSEEQSGVATVTVVPQPVATVTVTLAATTLVPGGTTAATAVLKDADGNTLPGRSVVWASSAPSVATVDGSGLVVAVAPGSSTITATSEGQSGVATVTVVPQQPASALSFPGNPNDPGVSPSVRFFWANPLPPRPATYIMRVFPRAQLSYYWGLGWVNGSTTWDEAATSYYGFQLYGAPGKVTAPYWEIAADNTDLFTGPAAFGSWPPTQQSGAGWYVHVARVSTGRRYRFHINWPNASPYIEHQDSNRPDPANPILLVGDVPWHAGFENYFGLIRGIQIYDVELTDAQVNMEIANPGSFLRPWYLNLNPTPTDITDKSGSGHHPAWGTTARPALWTGP